MKGIPQSGFRVAESNRYFLSTKVASQRPKSEATTWPLSLSAFHRLCLGKKKKDGCLPRRPPPSSRRAIAGLENVAMAPLQRQEGTSTAAAAASAERVSKRVSGSASDSTCETNELVKDTEGQQASVECKWLEEYVCSSGIELPACHKNTVVGSYGYCHL